MNTSQRCSGLFASLVALIVCASISPTYAALMTWNLDGVKFDSGPGTRNAEQVVTGWFVYDTSKMIITDWHLRSPDHYWPCCFYYDIDWIPQQQPYSYYSYADVVPDAAPGGGAVGFYFGGYSSNGPADLLLTTAKPLTDAGGKVPLLLNYSTAHLAPDSDVALIGGAFNVVSEPSACLLLAVGLIMLAGISARRIMCVIAQQSRFFGSILPSLQWQNA